MQNKRFIILTILYVISGVLAGAGPIIMTDVGQIFGINKSVVLGYFKNENWFFLVSFLVLGFAIFYSFRNQLQKPKWMFFWGAMWFLCLATTKFITPYVLFSAKQDSAEFISISEADKKEYLEDDSRVLVIDYNGVQKAYPPEWIWQAHIVGGDFDGEEIIFTYCVMTNLASPFKNDLNGNEVDFKVLAQTNNNLLIWDRNSNEVIQQITQECQLSEGRLNPIPIFEMTWAGYKKLFPEGTVVYNVWDNPIEVIVSKLFSPEETWYGEEFLFNTTELEDTRLPVKENIIGVRDPVSNEALAMTKDKIMSEKIINLSVGQENIVVAYFPEYETIMGFDRNLNGELIEVKELLPDGTIPDVGKLDRAFLYNSAIWAVWAYYYPETDVLM